MCTKSKTKAELICDLQKCGVNCAMGTNVERIKAMCQRNNIKLKHPSQPKIIEGWNGRPKGYLQILWERGFVDENELKQYTVNGRTDSYGLINKAFALKDLMSNCTDFQNEESLLQTNGRNLSVSIDRSPK